MSCPNPIELSRALVAGVDERLQAHLATCARCTAELEAHRAIADDMRVLPVVEPAPERARLVRAALMTTTARVPAAPRRLWMFGVGAATALAAAAILFVVVRAPAPPREVVAYRGSIHAHDGAQFIRVGGVPDEIVRLTQGTITVEVSPLQTGERFRVTTADGEVEVRGTAFDVTADADHLRAVRVLHGQVEVRASGAAPKLLAAGERWDMTLAMADEPAVPAPAIHDAPAVPAVIDQPVAPARRVKKPRTATSTPKAITLDTSKAPQPVPGAPKRPIEILFEQGWAALAAGNPRDAAATFERAATSAPNDPLAEDAWFWRASALARAKSAAAIGALEQFLARYPRSNRAGEASAVLGWIVIGTDPDRAEALFETATKDRVPAVRASAEKGLAAVAKQRAR